MPFGGIAEAAPKKRIRQELSVAQDAAVARRRNHAQRVQAGLQHFPDVRKKKPGGFSRLAFILSFVVGVLLPVTLAAVYYFVIASPQYMAEFRFTVKDTTPTNAAAAGGLMAALGQSGQVSTENYLVTDYLKSRQVVQDLQDRIGLIDKYSGRQVDPLSRFDRTQPTEVFLRYWQNMVTTYFDQVTGIATAQVRAFTPDDALLIANTMVKLSEELVNQIARRSQIDSVKFAEKEVEKAQERVKRIRSQIVESRPNGGAAGDGPLLLDVERQIAQTMLAGAMQTLEQSRQSAAAQHLYITPYIRPSLPESSTYPRPFVAVTYVFALAFGIWLIGVLMFRSIFDRFS